MTQQPMYPN